MTPAQIFLQAIADGYHPTPEEMGNICTSFHGVMVDGEDPELLWLRPSFEDMADFVTKAIECATQDEEVQTLRTEFENERHALPDARTREYWEKME
jgi:hypothetical protein